MEKKKKCRQWTIISENVSQLSRSILLDWERHLENHFNSFISDTIFSVCQGIRVSLPCLPSLCFRFFRRFLLPNYLAIVLHCVLSSSSAESHIIKERARVCVWVKRFSMVFWCGNVLSTLRFPNTYSHTPKKRNGANHAIGSFDKSLKCYR